MLTTTIKLSESNKDNPFKNAVWREATPEEESRALSTLQEFREFKDLSYEAKDKGRKVPYIIEESSGADEQADNFTECAITKFINKKLDCNGKKR